MSSSQSPKRRRQTKPHHEREICVAHKRKIRYSSRKRALSALNVARAKEAAKRAPRMPTAVYHCDACGDWHLTSRE